MASMAAISAKANDMVSLAQAFVRQYYTIFDGDRSKLGGFYGPASRLTFEGKEFQGVLAIVNQFVSLPFKKIAHDTKTMDCQPTPTGLLIFCSGQVKIDDDHNPIKFAQSFHIARPQNASTWLLENNIFRLNYG